MLPARRPLLLSMLLPLTLACAACENNELAAPPDIVTTPTPPSAPITTPVLAGRAVLPAATFADGPKSGQYLGGISFNGQAAPFARQPVQGFSAVLPAGNGSYFVMADNGYGSLENSADFNLRVYTLTPNFKTASGGNGDVSIGSFFELKDPNRRIPFAITNHFSTDRVLTGADFDIESMQRTPDGTFWFGDEFGPFLIHTDASGVVLDAPISLPDFENSGKQIRAPQSPLAEETSALRIMNAARAHAFANGGTRTPGFSPYYVELKYNVTSGGTTARSTPDQHYARGSNPQPGLTPATSEIHDVASIKSAGFGVVPYTINTTAEMNTLLRAGVTGIISDRPDLLLAAVADFDANNDGSKGDYLDSDGLIDPAKFDAQGHRGARNLRPENTLPGFEAALDNLMTTLETDTGISSDGVSVLKHDPYIEAVKCRRTDNAPYAAADEVLIKNLSAAQIQSTFTCDKLFRGASQVNDPALSPVSVALAQSRGYSGPYVVPRTQDVFDLVAAYITFYKTGAGSSHAQAALRVKNAERVRFNLETKINPRSDADGKGNIYKDRTVGFEPMVDTLSALIVAKGMQARADIQSFDFRTLIRVQERVPAIRTVYLFGDFPIYGDAANSDDGTNMQGEGTANTPWMAGLQWPYRSTVTSNATRAQRSGGFEGMAMSPDGSKLYPLLESPLTGQDGKTLLISEFDVATRTYTGKQFRYVLEARGTNIGDFTLYSPSEGIIIERDGSTGDIAGFKKLYRITLGAAGAAVAKTELVDLINIPDPSGISSGGAAGDVGLGMPFRMPFVTIEDVYVLDARTLLVMNDNNYPFSIGRHVGARLPDDNEFVLVTLPAPLTLMR
ncbi:MAG: esterase-like activity of phytase family protein [Pseudomonadota bacterium]